MQKKENMGNKFWDDVKSYQQVIRTLGEAQSNPNTQYS